jgi:hypothetical protein
MKTSIILSSLVLAGFSSFGQSSFKTDLVTQIKYENQKLKQWVVEKPKYNINKKRNEVKSKLAAKMTTVINENEVDWEEFFSPKNEPQNKTLIENDDEFETRIEGKTSYANRKIK